MKSLVVSRRVGMLLVSYPVTAVSCAQRAFSAGILRVGKAVQSVGDAVDVQVDGQLHPDVEGLGSTGVEMWSKRSESIRMTAPEVEQESVLRVSELLHRREVSVPGSARMATVPSRRECLLAQMSYPRLECDPGCSFGRGCVALVWVTPVGLTCP